MALGNIGKTIIDEARLCYTADDNVRKELSTIKAHRQEDGFVMFRTNHSFYKHCFTIHWGEVENYSDAFAQMYFGYTGNRFEREDKMKKDYVFYRLENHILYRHPEVIRAVLGIPTLYSMYFHHFTRIDFAQDYIKNTVKTINGLMKRCDIGTILNGKWVKNHKIVLDTLKEFRDRTLDRSLNPELIVMQKNALKNKNNGIIVAAYNKMAEVHNKQSQRTEYKQYIMDFYGNPQKSLHRLEVRVNAANITKYCDSHKIEMTEEILFDEHLLTAMYYEFLSRVLSFTHVSTSKTGKQCLREPISWDTIFCNKKI